MASVFTSTLFYLFLLSSCSAFSIANDHKFGFTVDLVHRDSPRSPFYNPEEAPFQRLQNAFRRSTNRARHFIHASSLSPNAPQSDIISNRGEYLMNISLGTPPFPILAIADTGSDLIWTQCEPCDQCYKQEAPLFDPSNSSTHRNVSCASRQCQTIEGTTCSSSNGTCQYLMSYGDGSRTTGNIAVDIVTLSSTGGRPVAIPKTIFGCGHQNAGSFNEKGSGIIGLGGGQVSLISQLGDSINGKFSYCLVPFMSEYDTTSKINFGRNAIISGPGAVSTPLVKKDPDTFYFLTLEAVSVRNKRLPFSGGSDYGTEEGNILIDSGTTLTLLPPEFYTDFESTVSAAIEAEPVQDPSGVLSLCYSASSKLNVPTITFHFKGADVTLKPLNTFVQVSDDVVCFAFSGKGSTPIFGNLSQMDFLVGYDTVSGTVSFKPTDCTKV